MHRILYVNGDIYTMDLDQPRAQALAIDGTTGLILAVGSDDEVKRVGGLSAECIDLRKRVVLPGFIDAHIHLQETAYRSHRIDASHCTNEDEVAALVRDEAARLPEGRWIHGGHWDHNRWSGQSFPSRVSLDWAAPHHPVALASNDGHSLWVNSLALQCASIDASTSNPPNGSIARSGDGTPTGILLEGATQLVFSVMEPPDPQLSRLLLSEAVAHLQSRGITTIHDIEDDVTFDAFQQLRTEQKLGVRVQMIFPYRLLSRVRTLALDHAEDDLLRVIGLKIFADGSLSSRTAAMLDSFEGSSHNYGLLTMPEQEMIDVVQVAASLNLIVAIHAIGDRAARVALNSIEHAQYMLSSYRSLADSAMNMRYRLEHVQLIAQDDLERMRRLGVVASIQPFHAVADRDIAETYWGRRHRRAYAYRTMHDMGIPIAFGSDAPVETFDPLRVLYASTLRAQPGIERPPWLPEQTLPLTDALWAYTLGAAYAGAEERRKGSLSVGKLGDAVVLREPLFQIPLSHMLENSVQATILGGQMVYGTL